MKTGGTETWPRCPGDDRAVARSWWDAIRPAAACAVLEAPGGERFAAIGLRDVVVEQGPRPPAIWSDDVVEVLTCDVCPRVWGGVGAWPTVGDAGGHRTRRRPGPGGWA